MIILQPISTAQEVQIYVRESTATSFTVKIIDESLNKTTSTTVTGVISDGVLTIDLTYNFIDNLFYNVQIFDGTNLIAYHKIYVTDQTSLDKYTVLDGYYTEVTKPETNYILK